MPNHGFVTSKLRGVGGGVLWPEDGHVKILTRGRVGLTSDHGAWRGRRGDQGSGQDCRKHFHLFHRFGINTLCFIVLQSNICIR